VRSGKALYAGISSYNAQRTREMAGLMAELGTPVLIHQPSYNILNRWIERDNLLDTLDDHGIGAIVYTPLAQGLLTNKYLGGIPAGSRALAGKSLDPALLSDDAIANLNKLNAIADARGQTLAQMAISWALRDGRVTSALIGASRPEQVRDCVGALEGPDFTDHELAGIDDLVFEDGINLWAASSDG